MVWGEQKLGQITQGVGVLTCAVQILLLSPETGSFLAETKRKDGAGKGIRTPDFNLGKVALYH